MLAFPLTAPVIGPLPLVSRTKLLLPVQADSPPRSYFAAAPSAAKGTLFAMPGSSAVCAAQIWRATGTSEQCHATSALHVGAELAHDRWPRLAPISHVFWENPRGGRSLGPSTYRRKRLQHFFVSNPMPAGVLLVVHCGQEALGPLADALAPRKVQDADVVPKTETAYADYHVGP
jgi:hypothetical protein